jgi:hypothetical protein
MSLGTGPYKSIEPSADDWEQRKYTLINLFENEDWTAEELENLMRGIGYRVT